MDNFYLDLIAAGKDTLRKAMQLFRPPGEKVVAYRVTEDHGMIFYWTTSDNATDLPFRMTLEQAADFAYAWLQQTDYGHEPDHDGDNSRGFRVYCECWGHVAGDWRAFAAVKPVWAMHGK